MQLVYIKIRFYELECPKCHNDRLFLKGTNKDRNISSKDFYKCFEDARNFFKCCEIQKKRRYIFCCLLRRGTLHVYSNVNSMLSCFCRCGYYSTNYSDFIDTSLYSKDNIGLNNIDQINNLYLELKNKEKEINDLKSKLANNSSNKRYADFNNIIDILYV